MGICSSSRYSCSDYYENQSTQECLNHWIGFCLALLTFGVCLMVDWSCKFNPFTLQCRSKWRQVYLGHFLPSNKYRFPGRMSSVLNTAFLKAFYWLDVAESGPPPPPSITADWNLNQLPLSYTVFRSIYHCGSVSLHCVHKANWCCVSLSGSIFVLSYESGSIFTWRTWLNKVKQGTLLNITGFAFPDLCDVPLFTRTIS